MVLLLKTLFVVIFVLVALANIVLKKIIQRFCISMGKTFRTVSKKDDQQVENSRLFIYGIRNFDGKYTTSHEFCTLLQITVEMHVFCIGQTDKE